MGLLVSKEDGDKGFYAESFKVNNNWMNRNIQFMKNTKLRDMSIIGSHDSGTYAITEDTTARGMARTQNCSLKEQCGYGIRYFDLRVGGDGKDPNKLAIYHGPIYCLGWKEGMQQIVDFIAENPKEVLILKFKKETAMSKAQQEYFLDFTMNQLGKEKIVTKKDHDWFNQQTVTLHEIVEKKKNYIVYQDKFDKIGLGVAAKKCFGACSKQGSTFTPYTKILEVYKDEDKEKKSLFQQPGLFTHQLINNIKKTKNAHIEKEIQEMPYFNKNTDLLSRWLNSDDPKKLQQMTLKDLEKHKNQKDKLLITQLTMTNNPTCGNICKWICGMKTAQVNVMTTALKNNPEFPKFLYKAIDHRDLNVVTLDFVAEKPEYCQFIISSNYEIDLKLHAVFWNGLPVDYTLLEKFIHNKNTLFLTNAKEELKKLGIMGPDEKEGTLLIGYSYLPLHDVFVTECFKETNFRGYKLCSHNDMVLITNFKNEFNDHNYDKGHYGNVWGFVNHREITEVQRDYLEHPDKAIEHFKKMQGEIEGSQGKDNVLKFKEKSFIIREVEQYKKHTMPKIHDCKTKEVVPYYNDHQRKNTDSNKDYQCIVCHEEHSITNIQDLFPDIKQYQKELSKLIGGNVMKAFSQGSLGSKENNVIESKDQDIKVGSGGPINDIAHVPPVMHNQVSLKVE